jgi:excisionase family DNA binding protein
MPGEDVMTENPAATPPAAAPGPIREPMYLTARDVAQLLQVAPSTIFRWVKRDRTVPALVLGGVVRFPRERLLVWLRQREQGGVARPRVSRRRLGPEDGAGGHADGHTGAEARGGSSMRGGVTR